MNSGDFETELNKLVLESKTRKTTSWRFKIFNYIL